MKSYAGIVQIPLKIIRIFLFASVFFLTAQFVILILSQRQQSSDLLSSFTSHPQNPPAQIGAPTETSSPQYHVVFSTSCNDQQHWESMVFFYHAKKVNQPGTVTRIVSGCSSQQEDEQRIFFENYIQPLRPSDFFIHFTPDFASLKKANGNNYKYMNKPYGLRHWMEGFLKMPSNRQMVENDIIILMDPDMILLRPLTHDFSDVDNHIWASEKTRVVKHGFPMSQQDGYLTNKWMALNMTHIVGPKDAVSMRPLPPRKDGPLYWNTGPPYLATARDMYNIVVKWTDYTPRVLDVFPKLFAEMFGFIFATVQLDLQFTMIKSIVVSVTTSSDREGWKFIDDMNDDHVCRVPTTGVKSPIVLHYCERYQYGPMFFSKYRLKKNIMSCDKSLLQPPPDPFVGQYNFTMSPPRADGKDKETYEGKHEPIKSPKIAKRDAFMLCGLIRSVNEALVHHKHVACPEGSANFATNNTVFNSPSNT